MRFSTFLPVAAISHVAAAASLTTPRRSSADERPPLPRALLSRQDQQQDPQPCGPNETVLTCAKYVAETWEVPVNHTGDPYPMPIAVTVNGTGKRNKRTPITGYILPTLFVEASNCSLSNAKIADQQDSFYCSIGFCQESFVFTTTETITTTFGFTSTVEWDMEEEVGFLFDFKLTVRLTEQFQFSRSDAKTVTNTTTKLWSLTNGQSCTPTTIQYSVNCNAKLNLAPTTNTTNYSIQGGGMPSPFNGTYANATYTAQNTHYAFYEGVYPNGTLSENNVTVTCDNYQNNVWSENNTQWNDYCESLASNGQPLEMDVGKPGYTGGVWSLEGCMWVTGANPDPTKLT